MKPAWILAASLAASCDSPTTPPPADPPDAQPTTPDPAVPPTDPPPHTPPTAEPSPGDGSVGAACNAHADCEGGICEGPGCGPNEGRCADKSRMCTRDLRAYCGCDGKTFRNSGSCPGARFSSKGECGANKDGEACLAAAECASEICEGQGCTESQPGRCQAKDRKCTADRVEYCGCDGKPFHGSGTCPSRRYASKGQCT